MSLRATTAGWKRRNLMSSIDDMQTQLRLAIITLGCSFNQFFTIAEFRLEDARKLVVANFFIFFSYNENLLVILDF